MPVLVGLIAGVTTTCKVTVSPTAADPGVEEPTPDNVAAVLRGLGAPTAKSVLLLSVSVAPAALRKAAVVLESVAVGPVPSKQFVPVPYPARSTILAPVGQVPERTVVLFTSATLPAPAAIAIPEPVPVASGVGRSVVPPAPAASLIK